MEILVVLAIIGLLATVAIKNVDKIFGDAQATTAGIQVRQTLKVPLTSYRIHMGDYPSSAEGLQALVTRPAAKGDRWFGPYADSPQSLVDPWGEALQYEYPGRRNKGSYDLWSKGPDKQSGTADDIGNWDNSAAQEQK